MEVRGNDGWSRRDKKNARGYNDTEVSREH